ncbi:tripartite tricarboxylate transporter substrate binding protein [Humitalea sp. 24SJ18S-53]|uniref:tripartite tricarboxylate transporter substrate binding protein n=1 Tax=Humitalea sp. 24SJ18S-53 TaxID=3422307 RepID=UPI003D667189
MLTTTRRMFLGAAAALPATAWAQAFPDRPMRLVLPYAPGGVVDGVGRIFAQGLGEALRQSVVTDNRPGAGGMIGTDVVAKAAPDGYTQLLMDPAVVINPSLQARVPYDLFRELRPVSILTSSPLVLITAPNLPVTSVAELIAYGRANPGRLSFASAGVGTTPHLAGEMFSLRSELGATHVPYRGIAAAYADMMAGQVHFSFSSIAGARPLIEDGRLKALATTGSVASPALPNLPTMQGAGVANFVVDLWLALFVPAATPDPVTARIHDALMEVISKPETVAALGRLGALPRGTTQAEAVAIVRAEYESWRGVITQAGITL